MRSRQRVSGRQLITPVSPSSFVQQGTVDWPSLANASVNASVSILTRLSGHGVELWTAAVAQVLLGNIRLSAEGESHINEALAKLYSFGSYGNLLYFGFGVKHMIRTLAESSEGMATVAICSSIAEVHGLAISTSIVYEYAKLYSTDAGASLMPSFRQWEALINSCSGALSRSPFGSVVEFFMRFHPQTHMCGDPKQVARALEGIAKISSGLMRSMVLIGNSECGFLAAVAQWLLGLRVVVRNVAGDIVYPSSDADTDNYQLMVIYSDDPDKSRAISRTADAYYIDYIRDILHESIGSDYVSGRVEWKTAISQTFGSSAMKIFQVPGILGEIIGSAAKIYSIDCDSMDLKTRFLQPIMKGFGPEASGRAFIDLALRQLPELANCKDAMELAVERPDEDARLRFEKTIAILKEVCGCSFFCFPQAARADFIDITALGSKYQPNDPKKGDTVTRCLPLLALTIIQLVRQLSTIASIPADLLPKRRGLEALLKKIEERYSGLRENVEDCPMSSITFLYTLVYPIGLLDLAALIFGVEVPFEHQQSTTIDRHRVSVWVNGGLCFIMDSVIRLSDRAEESLRVHIIPGHIEWNQKVYTRVQDGSLGSPRLLMDPMILPVPEAKYRAQAQLIDRMTARAIIMESSDCLRMSYEIKTASASFFLGPGQLSHEMAGAASGRSCSGKRCRPFGRLYEHFWITVYGLRLPYAAPGNVMIPFDVPEKPNIVLFGENPLARCTALADLTMAKAILQERECIACCARRALMAKKPHEMVIISRLTVEDMEQLLGRRDLLLLDR